MCNCYREVNATVSQTVNQVLTNLDASMKSDDMLRANFTDAYNNLSDINMSSKLYLTKDNPHVYNLIVKYALQYINLVPGLVHKANKQYEDDNNVTLQTDVQTNSKCKKIYISNLVINELNNIVSANESEVKSREDIITSVIKTITTPRFDDTFTDLKFDVIKQLIKLSIVIKKHKDCTDE